MMEISDEALLARLIRATAEWAPGASGLCIDPASESFRQDVVAYRAEVARRLGAVAALGARVAKLEELLLDTLRRCNECSSIATWRYTDEWGLCDNHVARTEGGEPPRGWTEIDPILRTIASKKEAQ